MSDVTGPPDKVDVELHLPLLEQFTAAFPMKAPNESDLIASVPFEIEVRVTLGPHSCFCPSNQVYGPGTCLDHHKCSVSRSHFSFNSIGFVALDNFYRGTLSKCKFKRIQKQWATEDANAIRYLLKYVFSLVRTQTGT